MDKFPDLISLEEWGLFPAGRPYIIAGPCSAESLEQVLDTAEALSAAGIKMFRAGVWKPRTRPGCFEGMGEVALDWLDEVKARTGMKVCTEVASALHVRLCLQHGVDMVWIGARTTTNPFLVQEIADALSGSDIPVLVKNPINTDIDLWIGAIERLYRAGIRKIGVVHRGFSSLAKIRYRYNPQWQVAVEMRSRFPQLPFFCDPSHIGGAREFVPEISHKAMTLGLDGLMVESHRNPAEALSDKDQQLTPDGLMAMLEGLEVRNVDTDNGDYRLAVDSLRARIDAIDDEILSALAARMDISRRIGEVKKANNVAIIQTARWENVLADVREKAARYNLPDDFVIALFNTIHDASIHAQSSDGE